MGNRWRKRWAVFSGVMLGAFPAVVLADTALPEIEVEGNVGIIAERRDAPGSRIVFSEEDVQRHGDSTVGDVLRRLPGVTFTGPPGTTKDIRMRGLDKGYTQILIDGEPVPGSTGDRQIQVDRLPAQMIERIEIIRNPTADVDSPGIGGTVNIVLKKTPGKPVASASIGAGMTGDEPVGAASGQVGNRRGGFSYLLNGGVTDRAEINLDTKTGINADGTIKDSLTEDKHVDILEYTLAPRFRWDLDDGQAFQLDPLVIATDEYRTKDQRKFSATGAPNGSQIEFEDKERTIARLRGSWQRRFASGREARISLTGQQGREEKERQATDRSAAGVVTKLAREIAEQRENELAARASLGWLASDNHQLKFGADLIHRTRDDEKTTIENGVAKVPGLNDAFEIEERRYVVYAQDAVGVGNAIMVTPGIRIESIETTSRDNGGNEFNSTVFAASPSLHYLQRMRDDLNFRASIAQTLRPPKFGDLTSIVESKAGTLTDPDKSGNVRLGPEKAIGVEAGIERFFDSANGVAGINFFYRSIEDLIERQTQLEGARYVSRPQNVGDAKVWGAELDFRRSAGFLGAPNLTIVANYTLLRSRVEGAAGEPDRGIKDQPPYVFNLGFEYRMRRWDATVGMGYNYIAAFTGDSIDENGARERKTESAKRLLDAYFVQALGKNLKLKVSAFNLLKDDKFRDATKYNGSGAFASRETRLEESERTFMISLDGNW